MIVLWLKMTLLERHKGYEDIVDRANERIMGLHHCLDICNDVENSPFIRATEK